MRRFSALSSSLTPLTPLPPVIRPTNAAVDHQFVGAQLYNVGEAAAVAVGATLGRLVGATLSQRPNITLRQRRLPTSRRPCWLRWANVFSTELCYRGISKTTNMDIFGFGNTLDILTLWSLHACMTCTSQHNNGWYLDQILPKDTFPGVLRCLAVSCDF